MKNNYVLNVGNIGNIPYANKKESVKDYNDYVKQSKSGYGRASSESVTLFCNGEIIRQYTGTLERFEDNNLINILSFDKCLLLVKAGIKNKDSVVILCPHYSINIASKYDDVEMLQWDLDELSDYLGYYAEVSDYDDLIVSLTDSE
jgi:hypothetical protein